MMSVNSSGSIEVILGTLKAFSTSSRLGFHTVRVGRSDGSDGGRMSAYTNLCRPFLTRVRTTLPSGAIAVAGEAGNEHEKRGWSLHRH